MMILILSIFSKIYLKIKIAKVIGFTNPLEALEHYKTNCNRYGLVISDIRMAEMSGFDLLKNIKKIDVTISFF